MAPPASETRTPRTNPATGSVPIDARPPRLCVLGGAISTGNLGVSSLGVATVRGVLGVLPDARVTLQNSRRDAAIAISLGDRQVELATTRLHEADKLRARAGTRHLRLLTGVHRHLPGPLKRWLCSTNRTFDQLVHTDLVLDLSAGDSFSDIYGPRIMKAMADLKLLILEMRKPLVLLPQTFGPYRSEHARQLAREVLGRCALVATRDSRGEDQLRQVLGGWLPDRVVTCPDVAFTLDPVPVAREREPFALDRTDERQLIGLNVSGLLLLSEQRFGLKEPYSKLIRAIVDWALSDPDRRLLLIPHVISRVPPPSDPSLYRRTGDVSDTLACRTVRQTLPVGLADRVGCLGWPYNESETKYLIGTCNFMIGARMHACISAVSQAIPTVTLAYSDKAAGVMGHVGPYAPVIDLRRHSVRDCVESIDHWYARRHELRAGLPEIASRLRAQVDQFFDACLLPLLPRSTSRRHTHRHPAGASYT